VGDGRQVSPALDEADEGVVVGELDEGAGAGGLLKGLYGCSSSGIRSHSSGDKSWDLLPSGA
jgi:hypothetical protein